MPARFCQLVHNVKKKPSDFVRCVFQVAVPDVRGVDTLDCRERFVQSEEHQNGVLVIESRSQSEFFGGKVLSLTTASVQVFFGM